MLVLLQPRIFEWNASVICLHRCSSVFTRVNFWVILTIATFSVSSCVQAIERSEELKDRAEFLNCLGNFQLSVHKASSLFGMESASSALESRELCCSFPLNLQVRQEGESAIPVQIDSQSEVQPAADPASAGNLSVVRKFKDGSSKTAIRYRLEISSEPWSWSKVTTELDVSSYPVAYCGQWDFLFWLVVERQDFQDELGLTTKQRNDFEIAKTEISKLRSEFASSLRTSASAEKGNEKLRKHRDALIEDIANRVEGKVRKLLTDKQANRLQQLARQDHLARFPRLTVLGLDESYSAEFHSGDRSNALGLTDRELALLASDVERQNLRGELGSSVTGSWLKGVLEEQAVGRLQKGLSEFGLQVVPLVEIVGLENTRNRHKEELKSKRSTEELWNLTSTIVVHPTGRTEWRISETDESGSGDFNLLMSLATGPTFARYLELTQEQVELAQTLANQVVQGPPDARNAELRRNQKNALDSEAAISRLLLPFQLELLEERAVWREVEIYGVAPCILYGRLNNYLEISSEQKKRLMSATDITLGHVRGAFDSVHKKRLELIRSRLESDTERQWFDSFFGKPPQKITFRY